MEKRAKGEKKNMIPATFRPDASEESEATSGLRLTVGGGPTPLYF